MMRSGAFLVVLMAAGAFSQCPCQQQTTSCPTSTSSPPTTCPNATNIDRSISTLYQVQPVFIKMLPATDDNKQLDHICTTFFKSCKDNNTFIVYETRTYLNCSSTCNTYIGANVGSGANAYSNPLLTYVSNIVGGTNCSAFVKYRCNTYGADVNPFVFAQGPIVSNCSGSGCGFTSDCLQEALQVIQSSGLPAYYAQQEYYVLPCKCPLNCVYQQACVDPGNPIYSQQGGVCKPASACTS